MNPSENMMPSEDFGSRQTQETLPNSSVAPRMPNPMGVVSSIHKRHFEEDWEQGHHDPKSLKQTIHSVAPQVQPEHIIPSNIPSSSVYNDQPQNNGGMLRALVNRFKIPMFSAQSTVSPDHRDRLDFADPGSQINQSFHFSSPLPSTGLKQNQLIDTSDIPTHGGTPYTFSPAFNAQKTNRTSDSSVAPQGPSAVQASPDEINPMNIWSPQTMNPHPNHDALAAMFDPSLCDFTLPPFAPLPGHTEASTTPDNGGIVVAAPRRKRKPTKKGKGKEVQNDDRVTEQDPVAAATNAIPLPSWPVFSHPQTVIPSVGTSTGIPSSSVANIANPWVNPPLPISMEATGEYGPFLSFVSTRLDHMTYIIQKNQTEQANIARSLKVLEVTSQHQVPTPGPSVSQEPSPPSFTPPKAKVTRKMRSFVPRPKEVDETENLANMFSPERQPTDSERNETLNFLAQIRKHLLLLLRIKSLDDLLNARCTLTEDEHSAFDLELPECIVITANDFRLDLSRHRNTSFNTAARAVFAEDFRTKVVQDRWYSKPGIPERYLDVTVIEEAFYNHMRYVKERFGQLQAPRAQNEQRLQRSARGTRKRRLHKDRIDAVSGCSSLEKHLTLLKAIGSQGMSSDESDTEELADEKTVAKSAAFIRVYPSWRGSQLAGFLWHLDNVVSRNRTPIVGTRKRRGAAQRTRSHSHKYNQGAPAPPNLPRNCYSPEWLATIEKNYPRQFKGLNVLPQDYVFDGFEGAEEVQQDLLMT